MQSAVEKKAPEASNDIVGHLFRNTLAIRGAAVYISGSGLE